jgi:hypothetical protein
VIEVASEPADLTGWPYGDPGTPEFYLEVFGETEPTVDLNYAEVLPPTDTTAQSIAASPIYEYWWTVGHPGYRKEHHHFLHPRSTVLWDNLDDVAAHVFLYFPINAGWRIKELIATVKYLSPNQSQKTLSEKAGADWQKMSPYIADAASISSLLSPLPVVGAGAAAAAPVLSALSKLQIGSVPSTADGFEWYVDKVTTAGEEKRGVMQGVMWSIPKTMFESLGGRLTGSLAVSFIQSHPQGSKDDSFKPGNLCGHAVVFANGEQHWVPASPKKFVELQLSPRAPSDPQPAPAASDSLPDK